VFLQPESSAHLPHVGAARTPTELIVVGAAAVDVIAQADSSTRSDSSLINASTVPGTVETSLGGVARNVAEAAHRTLLSLKCPDASHRTLLVAPLGDDSFGAIIRQETESVGMRSDGLLVTTMPGCQTATHRAERRSPVCNMVLSRTGDLIGGVADFTALDTLRSSEVRSAHRIVA
jgi:pseudouridine-5'-phosphate glycosidase/pseudouridine kinase